MAVTSATLEGVELVWLAAKFFVADTALACHVAPIDSRKRADDRTCDLRGKTIDEAPTFTRLLRLREAIDLPGNFDQIKPAARAGVIAACGAPEHLVGEFVDTASQLNVLRSAQGSIRSVASGLNSYLLFCGVLSAPPFPVTTSTVRRWGAAFNPGKTFAQYTAHLRKASILLHYPTDWFSEEIRAISRGLRNAQDRSLAFPNYITSGWAIMIIHFEGRFAPMDMVAYLSYLFPLRVPSATIRLERASPSIKLTTFAPQIPKAIIGTDALNRTPVLVIKFRCRKNIRGGCILIRPCL